MDISKIRKKAREREEKSAERPQEHSPAPKKEEPEVKNPPELKEEAPSEKALHEDAPDLNAEPAAEREAATPAGQSREEEQIENIAEEDEQMLELLTFRLSNEEFAFKVPEVQEIIRYQSITKVPSLPDYVQGITSLRGKIIPVIDLKKRLDLKKAEDAGLEQPPENGDSGASKEKILIIEGPKGFIGTRIDNVMGVVRFPHGNVLDPPAHLTEEELKFIEGVVILEKRFISIIRSEDALNIEVG